MHRRPRQQVGDECGLGFRGSRTRRLQILLVGVGGLFALGYWPSTVVAADIDPSTRLVRKPGWELVRAQCGGCHSYGLITNQRGDRQTWLEIIRWMQQTQNFWELGVEVEAAILDYLAENYPPAGKFRRAPLPGHLMPEPANRGYSPSPRSGRS